MEVALRARLKADATVTGIAGTRIDWTTRPQKRPAGEPAFPVVLLTTIFDDRTQHMGGFDDFRETRVQIDCLAETRAEVIALREAVITAIAPAATQSGVTFLRAQQFSVVDRGANTDTGFIHRDMIEASIWHDA